MELKDKTLIGFGGTYYTLWGVSYENQYWTDSYGKHWHTGTKEIFTYHKNISKNLEKVATKYPGIQIDMDLTGKKSFWRFLFENQYPEGYFYSGKHEGEKVADLLRTKEGRNYCKWYTRNFNNKLSKFIDSTPLFARWYRLKQYFIDKSKSGATKLEAGKVYEFEFLTNGRNGGWLRDKEGNQKEIIVAHAIVGNAEIVVKFPEGGRHVNGMYPYIMPILNGTAQKTKGRKIALKIAEITKETWAGRNFEYEIKAGN